MSDSPAGSDRNCVVEKDLYAGVEDATFHDDWRKLGCLMVERDLKLEGAADLKAARGTDRARTRRDIILEVFR